MRAVVFLIFLGAALAAASVPYRGGSRIVGGTPTTIANYPFITNMQRLWFGTIWSQSCGGSLLTSRTIVSAAHCFDGDSPSIWRTRVGTSFASSGGVVHNIESFILHEEYSRRTPIDKDVAIVRLASAVTFNDNVKPVRIAGSNYNLPDGTSLIIAGWGALVFEGAGLEQLQHVQVYQINQELCAARYAFLKTQPGYDFWPDITDAMLCAGIQDVGGKDACQGDSGGPLIHGEDILYGIVSWSFECADAYYPSVNARVPVLSDWIVQNGSISLSERQIFLLIFMFLMTYT